MIYSQYKHPKPLHSWLPHTPSTISLTSVDIIRLLTPLLYSPCMRSIHLTKPSLTTFNHSSTPRSPGALLRGIAQGHTCQVQASMMHVEQSGVDTRYKLCPRSARSQRGRRSIRKGLSEEFRFVKAEEPRWLRVRSKFRKIGDHWRCSSSHCELTS